MAAPRYKSHLLGKFPRVEDIVTFRFERPPGYHYRAGQWLVITFQGPDGPLDHHFSHSSSPTEPWVEFTTRLRDSEFKSALVELEPGAEVEIEAPFGSFVLEPGADPVAFLAGGIGITCVRSILKACVDELADHAERAGPAEPADPAGPAEPRRRPMTLIFANRSEDGIPFREELAEMESKLPSFRVVHVLSRAGEQWTGRRGHISADILDRELPRSPRRTYYVSGPPAFASAMQDLLAAQGVDPDRVTAERFEGY